jgi:hypothetical protein
MEVFLLKFTECTLKIRVCSNLILNQNPLTVQDYPDKKIRVTSSVQFINKGANDIRSTHEYSQIDILESAAFKERLWIQKTSLKFLHI